MLATDRRLAYSEHRVINPFGGESRTLLKPAKSTDLSGVTLDNRRNCRHNHMLDAEARYPSIGIHDPDWLRGARSCRPRRHVIRRCKGLAD